MVAIVRRNAWGARTSVPYRPLTAAARFVVWHYPGGTVGNDGAAVTRSIETQHRNLGWSVAPGYNYLIARNGQIFEGAGLMRGIHSPPRNADGFGVQLMVNPGENPTQAQRNSGRALYLWLNQQTRRTLTPWWHGRDHPTACPGPQVIAWVRAGMPGTAPAPPPPPPPRPPFPSLVPGEETVHVTFGADRRASLGVPRNATHLRLTSAQTVRVDATWPGGQSRAHNLSSNANGRADFSVAGNSTGQVILTREAGSNAEVYATWIVRT